VNDETFPKTERVRKSDEFSRILEEGRRVRGELLSAFWLPGPAGASRPNRVGMAAGKRLGNAVLRNRLKRWMREAYRRHKRELPCRGVSIVFLASRRMPEASYAQVRDELVSMLRDMASSVELSSRP
jgi:ribonuclease P protein component